MDSELLAVVSRVPAVVSGIPVVFSIVQAEFSGIPLGFFKMSLVVSFVRLQFVFSAKLPDP